MSESIIQCTAMPTPESRLVPNSQLRDTTHASALSSPFSSLPPTLPPWAGHSSPISPHSSNAHKRRTHTISIILLRRPVRRDPHPRLADWEERLVAIPLQLRRGREAAGDIAVLEGEFWRGRLVADKLLNGGKAGGGGGGCVCGHGLGVVGLQRSRVREAEVEFDSVRPGWGQRVQEGTAQSTRADGIWPTRLPVTSTVQSRSSRVESSYEHDEAREPVCLLDALAHLADESIRDP